MATGFIAAVPKLSTWGLVSTALLLVALGLITERKRSNGAAAGAREASDHARASPGETTRLTSS